jgi:uncharacterized membrane protein
MTRIAKIFLQGFMAILPIVLTLYILYGLAASTESLLGRVIRFFIKEAYIPGMGIAAGFLLIFGIGILLHVWLFRKIFDFVEKSLEKVPLIKTLYGSIRDLMSFFDTAKKKEFDKVVMVTIADTRLMGLVTREDFNKLPAGIDTGQTVAVYLPMSYQLGGFTAFVERANIHPVDMRIEEAMRFIVTAGVSTRKQPLSETL